MYYNCHSCFSLRYGTLTVDALLDLAAEKGFAQLGLTDINNTSAGLEFVRKAREKGIRPWLGIEFRSDNRLRYIGLAKNTEGWRHLCEFLSTNGARNHEQYQQAAEVDSDGESTGHFPERAPELPDTYFIYPFGQAPPPGDLREDEYIGVRPVDLNRLYNSPCRKYPGKLLTYLPVTFKDKVGFNTHRLLRSIDRNSLLSKQESWDVSAQDEVMYTMTEILQFYQHYPELVTNTLRLVEQCSFDLAFDQPRNKKYFTGSRYDDLQLLEKLTWDGVRYRYGGRGNAVVEERVRKELSIIDQMGFSAYFLITWDFVRYGQSRGFFHVGRGSGANSIVAYCMGITDVDPIELNLYFERFLNPHRSSPPDFDIDFSWKDRDEVIDYVFKRYGQQYTSLMATYNTFKGRSIIRELGKVFGLPKAEIDLLVARRHAPQVEDHIVKLIYRYGKELDGMPNYLGIHPGGILISEEPIRSYAATEIPPKGFPIVQFDMFVAEDAGLYKYDVLSQRGLGHIKDSAITVRENRGTAVDVHQVSSFKEDPKIADLIRRGDTIGCFYVESPAMRQLLRKLSCDNYLNLVAASSVIRPGVAKSGMMRQFIERHNGATPSETWYLHPKMESILGETYGVMVYQEDVIKVAHHFGGVALADADVLRRGMSGKYRSRNHFDVIRQGYFDNCRKMGYDETVTAEVWRQMESFSGYSFCKAHSASFAVESYQSLYFKAHYPREFMVGVINNFGGFYRTETYVHEARRGGAVIEAPCVNLGGYLTSIRDKTIWLGFIHIQGPEKKTSVRIEGERQVNGPYASLEDLLKRVPMGLELATVLIRVGALRFTGKTKKELLWEVNLKYAKEVPRQQDAELFVTTGRAWQLPQLPDDPVEDAYDELELLGFVVSPVADPAPGFAPERMAGAVAPPVFTLLEKELDRRESLAQDFAGKVGRTVVISGYLICTKQVRTVKGDMMGFSDFIDARGDYFDAVLFPQVYQRFPLNSRQLYRLRGKLIDDFGVVTMEVERMERLAYRGDPRNG